MPGTDISEALGEWEGYEVTGATRRQDKAVEIELTPIDGRPGVCSGCQQEVAAVHDYEPRRVRDLPILGAFTTLLLARRRLACPQCGPKLEHLSWLAPYARVTQRLAESVAQMCAVMPIKHVARHYRLGWDAVKEMDKAYLQRTLGPVRLHGVTLLVMDEFALRRGHRYATVIADAVTKRVLWVGKGRRREDIRPFFQLLGEAGCAAIEAVAMDMNGAYEPEVKQHCPQAQIVYDLFHVVAKYGREVVDRVRVDEANRLRGDPQARAVVKGSRWLLLRNRRNIRKRADRIRLRELLEANAQIAAVYILRDDLKHLWDYRREGVARRFWEQWYGRALDSGIAPLIKFAKAMKKRLHGILAHCHWPLHTSVIEGINNKIKVIKRMAYGLRDTDYFFLKIRAAFPGDTG